LGLADYRAVYFATHGLLAGDVKGLGEPSLALTIPNEPSELDDGLLTASEVAQLKLNADWVVLSACNTAAGDKPGAEALSGLARAFFYAGARALLVSHWAVDSDAATRLTTTTFDILPEARPRGGATPRHARLHERCHGPAERLSGTVGTVRDCRRGGRAVSDARQSLGQPQRPS
jgi:CHAT domain-containing protein